MHLENTVGHSTQMTQTSHRLDHLLSTAQTLAVSLHGAMKIMQISMCI